MRVRYDWRFVLFALVLVVQLPAPGQDDADAEREAKVVERFVTLLEKTPRRGTALDRVYGFHVERGTLEALTEQYRLRTEKAPKDGASWMVLGLVEAQRGRDALAVAAFREAEKTRPDDALASFYLGQTLVLIGQPDAAVAAFERALARKPARADAMEMYQALGRVHQRARRDAEALKVWERLEKQFPEDARVAEQIALTLAEEGQSALALPRYEKLAATARDPYRKLQYKMEAADLKVRLGKKGEAIDDFEGLLGNLNPESWLSKEVRRKLEDVFLRNDDQAGLASYYESWIKKHPDDIDSIARRARVLAALGRAPEAREALTAAVKLAPSRKELRLALVEQFVAEKKFGEAAQQYEEMARAEPGNPDTIREWGRLLLRDPARPEDDRKRAAATVWRKLLDARPKDANAAAQVAELFRKAELTDEALSLYRKAIDLAPEAPQYHEYLGEFLHSLKRGDEALATWTAMAAGANRTPANLARLAEVLSGFGYKKEAEKVAAETVALDPKAFGPRLKHADVLAQLERFEEALAELDAAEPLADDPEQREAVLAARIRGLQASGKLGEMIDALIKELEAGQEATSARFLRLARYHEAAQRLPDAAAAVRRAVDLDPKSVPALAAAARIEESSGNLGSAADVYRQLAAIDRRARTEHLTAIARLEARLGRRDEALKAGRDVLASAPNNPEHYQTFAELCFSLGETEEGLKALRRAARLNEADPKAALTLGEALATQFRTDEAIEIYWRAFDKSPTLDAKVGIVAKLANLYLQQNQFERLLARIERAFQEGDAQQLSREKAACLAQAHTSAGDYQAARQQLEGLLVANSRDTQLLQQLCGLAETEGDFASAARYQKQVNDLAPGFEGATRLAQFYLRAGEFTEAENVWASIANDDTEAHRVLQAIDSLAASRRFEMVLSITEKLLRRDPDNWDLIYREATALQGADKPKEAQKRFQDLLALRANDNDLALLEKVRRKSSSGRPTGASTFSAAAQSVFNANPMYRRVFQNYELKGATGIDPRYANMAMQAGQSGRVWTPIDYGQARQAALAWLLVASQRDETDESFLKRLKDTAEAPDADPRAARDWYYLTSLRNEPKDLYTAALKLARSSPNDPECLWAVLSAATNRASPGANTVRVASQGPGNVDRTPPLPDDEVNTLIAAFDGLRKREPSWANTVAGVLMTELQRAKRTADADAVYRDLAESANDLNSVSLAMSQAAQRGDVERLFALSQKADRLQLGRNIVGLGGSTLPATLGQAMAVLVEAKRRPEDLKLLDHALDALSLPDRVAKRAKGSGLSSALTLNRASGAQVYLGRNNMRVVSLDYPNENAYFDIGTINLLRNAYELYKKDDLLSDLTAHLQDRLKAARRDPTYERLALAYVKWWNDEKDEALRDLTEIAQTVPNDADMKLSLAELRSNRNEHLDALALADSVEPTDQKLMQRRELLALRLAVLTGNVDRARRAAERLFGLRLDANTQVQLAQQMHQLGMHELAEAVLGRARRRSGNDPNALANLMMQYQRQDRMDEALQVAYQIMRRSPQRSNQPYVISGSIDAAQAQALQLLSRSGKLNEQIERLESQVERSPGSIGLHQTLAMYYNAAGKRDKVKQVQAKLLELRPDDAPLRWQIAYQAANAGEWGEAVDHYIAAMRKDPSNFAQDPYRVVQAFRTAKRMPELGALVRELDLRAFSRGNSYAINNLVSNLSNDPTTREMGLELFRRSWKFLPAPQRQQLLAHSLPEDIWRLPEIYDHARDLVVPKAAAGTPSPWSGFDSSILSYTSNSQAQTLTGRLFDIAESQGKLEELKAEIAEARQRWPDWLGGKALQCLIDIRLGNMPEALLAFEELLEKPSDGVVIPSVVVVILGQEIDRDPATQDLAERFYKAVLNDPAQTDEYVDSVLSTTSRLANLYLRMDKPELARGLLLQPLKVDDERYSFDTSYAAYRKVEAINSRGSSLLGAGFPADAVRLFNSALADTATLNLANQMYGGGQDQLGNNLRNQVQRALTALERGDQERTLRSLVWPEGVKAPYGEALDLVLIVQPRELLEARIVSLLGDSLTAALKRPERFAEARDELKRLAAEKPDDLSARVAWALAAIAEGKAEAIDGALKEVLALVERSPLEELPRGVRANSRQRDQAAKWLGVWPVARFCLQDESRRPLGQALANRVREAARRQNDSIWLQAVLRESGQIALDAGDKALAEKLWTELLELILVPPKTSSGAGGGTSLVPAPAPAPAAIATTSSPVMTKGVISVARLAPAAVAPAPVPALVITASGGAAGTTVDRFSLALDVARLAAENGLVRLSLQATREALKGGPPITAINVDPNNQRYQRILSPYGVEEPQRASGQDQVWLAVGPLERAWSEAKVPPQEVYDLLREIVLPEARPREAFLYPLGLASGPASAPRSVGALLVTWALRAKATEDLAKRIEARAAEPMAELPLKVLTTMLALNSGNHEEARRGLDALRERLDKDSLQNTAELACHAALPALLVPECADAAEPLVTRAIKRLSPPGQTSVSASNLGIVLARHLFTKDKAEMAASILKDYQTAIEREPRTANPLGQVSTLPVKTALVRVATEYTRAGRVEDTLATLGKYADLPALMSNEPKIAPALQRLSVLLSALPAPERYQRLLEWTMPTDQRKLVRILACGAPTEAVPAIFGPRPPIVQGGVVSTADLLIEAARETGKLDELAERCRQAAETKIELANVLSGLIAIARGQSEMALPALQECLDARQKKQSEAREAPIYRDPSQEGAPRDWPEAILARRSLGSPKLNDVAGKLATLVNNGTTIEVIREYLNSGRAAPKSSPTPPEDALPAGWLHAPREVAAARLEHTPVSRWVLLDEVLGRVGHFNEDDLYFTTPLRGTFTIEAELTDGARIGHGGLFLAADRATSSRQDNATGVLTVSTPVDVNLRFPNNETVSRRLTETRGMRLQRATIDVSPERTRFLVNGHLIHEAKGAGSPWLALAATTGQFHTLTITGAPEVPRVVKLVENDDLRQWTGLRFGESVRPKKGPSVRPPNDSEEAIYYSSGGGAVYQRATGTARTFDWEANEGEITGRRAGPARPSLTDAPVPSVLSFVRPLGDGESLSYEFRHVPGQDEVHPALGRLVFQLDPDRVRLRWITDTTDLDPSGLAVDNLVDDPAIKQGAGPLPLKAGEWNAMVVTLKEGRVALTLNGQMVAERPLEAANPRTFSLFHFKDRGRAKVRNVTLSGDWPTTLPANLLAPAVVPDDAARRARSAWLADTTVQALIPRMLAETRRLPAPERYARLLAWVLPTSSHSWVRLQWRGATPDEGGQFAAPALELMKAARDADKLDELAANVDALETTHESESRAKTALRALVAGARGRSDEARAALADLAKATKALPPETSLDIRLAETIALAGALKHRDLLEAAEPLAAALLERAKGPPDVPKGRATPARVPPPVSVEPPVSVTDLHVLRLVAERDRLAKGGPEPQLSPRWLASSRYTATSLGQGLPLAQWDERDGRITHTPGHALDLLYFRTPLQGDFDVSARLETLGDDQVIVDYGGIALQVAADGKTATLTTASGARRELPLDPPIDPAQGPVPFRLTVKEGRCVFFLADRQVAEAPTRRDGPPWLVLRSAPAGRGALADFRIGGQPKVPERVSLIGPNIRPDDWQYHDTTVDAPWKPRIAEIVGTRQANVAGSVETTIRHARPLADQETITYEFYHEKGDAAAHPALGRDVFLIGADGVRSHRLTGPGAADEYLNPDNRTEVAGMRRGPVGLKDRDWNRLALTLSGDKVLIRLNDQMLGEAPAPADVDRRFGLFRYADGPAARVRKVEVSGPWKFAD